MNTTPFLSPRGCRGRVESESQAGEEVTQQHADLVAPLKNARDTEPRLRDLLLERTGKIADVVSVEREIARVRGEIESMEWSRRGSNTVESLPPGICDSWKSTEPS